MSRIDILKNQNYNNSEVKTVHIIAFNAIIWTVLFILIH